MIRRNFIRHACAVPVAASAGTAGCLDGGSVDGSSEEFGAPYDRWVSKAVFSSGTASVQSYDSELLRTGSSGESADLEYLPERGLIGHLAEALRMRRFLGAGFDDFGLEAPIKADGPVDRFHELLGYAGTEDGGWVYEGSFDARDVERSLEEAGATKETEYGGYTVFSGSHLFGVSDDVLVRARIGEGSKDRFEPIEAVIDAGSGGGTRFSDEYPAYSDLLTALDENLMMSILFTPEAQRRGPESTTSAGETDTETPADSATEGDHGGEPLGVATSSNFGPDRTSFAVALRYARNGDVGDEAAYEANFGQDTDDVTVEIDDLLVTVSATYTRDGN